MAYFLKISKLQINEQNGHGKFIKTHIYLNYH